MATNATVLPSTAPATPSRWISQGWGIVREDLGTFILITLIALALWLAVGFTVIGHFLVGGPLISGMFIAIRRRMQEGRTEFMDLFSGFNLFIDSFLICLLTSLFAFLGLLLCIFPVFFVGAIYLFPFLFLIDRRLSFWDAMEASRRLVASDLLGYVIFVILLALLNLVGLMLAGVGLLVTIPTSMAAVAVAYRDVTGFRPKPPEARGPVIIP
jgi:uncharacterized membrane protein